MSSVLHLRRSVLGMAGRYCTDMLRFEKIRDLARVEPPRRRLIMENLLTAREVARLLAVSEWHVGDLARTRQLRSVCIGSRRRRFRPADVAVFIEGRAA